jgi:hypothetical protein
MAAASTARVNHMSLLWGMTAGFVAMGLLCLAGCKPKPRPELWQAGLTLPSGSTTVTRSTEDPSGRKVLNIGFNNPGGWVAVRQHFDDELTALGYTGQGAASEMIHAGRPDEAPPERLSTTPSEYIYNMPAGQFQVSITNNRLMTEDAHLSKEEARQTLDKIGEFQLLVVPTRLGEDSQ